MKYILSIIALMTQLTSFSQITKDLIGTWQITKIVNNSSSEVAGCMDAAKDYKLTFNSDNTYSFDSGPGHITTGSWKIEGDKINFFNSKLSDPSQGNVADHACAYKIDDNGILIIDEYMCSELGGKTYYKKNKLCLHKQ